MSPACKPTRVDVRTLPVGECLSRENGALRYAATTVHPGRVDLSDAVPMHRERLVEEIVR